MRRTVRKGRKYVRSVMVYDGTDTTGKGGEAQREVDGKAEDETEDENKTEDAPPMPPNTAHDALVPRPPRQLLHSVEPTFDVWGFGCVLYQLCTGRPLFEQVDSSDDNIYDRDTCVKLRTWTEIDNKRLSYIFEDEQGEPVQDFARDLIRQCLNGDPAKRPQTMAKVLEHRTCTLSRYQCPHHLLRSCHLGVQRVQRRIGALCRCSHFAYR